MGSQLQLTAKTAIIRAVVPKDVKSSLITVYPTLQDENIKQI